MSILSGEQLSHAFNDTWLFKNITLSIAKGQRIALVGINGSGKSTLLRILAERLIPDEGKVVKERGLKTGYLEQDPDFGGQNTISAFIYSLDNKQQQLIRRYEQLASDPDADQDELQKLIHELSELNAWEYEHKIKTILQRLSIADTEQEISSLSGGQRKRLALAKLLIDEPDILILDEPTNHLDIEMIEWLENFLTSGQKTVLMVTHDRYFLDNVCNMIIELDKQRLFAYAGKYSYFLEKKSEREAEETTALQKNRNLLKKELEWMRRQPQARGTKSKARIDAFYELEQKTKENGKQTLGLESNVSRQGRKILEIEHISKTFQDKVIIDDFSYTFKKGDRIGIAGKNGSGKSTLLNLITGTIAPDSGNIIAGETTVFGYYKQSGLEINESEKVIDVVTAVAEHITMSNGKIITASQLLTRFLFPPNKQYNPVRNLSGGERKRLQLMRVLMRNPNFLILDEPTNDLDIDTLNILEDFLESYTGVLLLVSHDRYLMDKLTDQLFILEGNMKVRVYSGNYSDYRIEKEREVSEYKARESLKTSTTVKEENSQKKKLSYKEQQELEILENEIPSAEAEINIITDKMNSGIIDHEELIKLAAALENKKNHLDKISLRWMELIEIQDNK